MVYALFATSVVRSVGKRIILHDTRSVMWMYVETVGAVLQELENFERRSFPNGGFSRAKQLVLR